MHLQLLVSQLLVAVVVVEDLVGEQFLEVVPVEDLLQLLRPLLPLLLVPGAGAAAEAGAEGDSVHAVWSV